MLYQIMDGTVSVGGKQILSHIHFEIKGKEKVGLVGSNGAGKSTLLRLIAGELMPDADDHRTGAAIKCSEKLSIGMLSQTGEEDPEKTVDELVRETAPVEDPYSREYYTHLLAFDRMFTELSFPLADKQKKLKDFSGGEKTKIRLLCLLIRKPDILLLDEPTNHLDIRTTEWLEEYLKSYDRAVLVVSHDRFFLDQVTDVIYALRDGTLKRYAGNYTSYRETLLRENEKARKQYEKQKKEEQRLTELIERFKTKPRKAAFARSRKTILERMEKAGPPPAEESFAFREEIVPLVPANKWILECRDLLIGCRKGKSLAEPLSLRIQSGKKIGIIGGNGAGKTTFLKTLAGVLSPAGGSAVLGERTTIGYFDQESAAVSSELSVIDHFRALFPNAEEKELRKTLGHYLFSGQKASVRVGDLSGGEKARLYLAELLESRPNLLILDEPTNHMDISAKETLESAFRAYKGTIFFVSHDRYFISRIADAVLIFEGNHIFYDPFGYRHYLEQTRKKKEGKEMWAVVRSQDQALLDGFRAVPEKEKGRFREIGTEEAYLDWKRGLASQELAEAGERVRLLQEKWDSLSKMLPYLSAEESLKEELAQIPALKEKLDAETGKWTEACIRSFELWEN